MFRSTGSMIGCPLLSRSQNSVGVETSFEDADQVVVIGLTDIIPAAMNAPSDPVTVHPELVDDHSLHQVNPLKVLLR